MPYCKQTKRQEVVSDDVATHLEPWADGWCFITHLLHIKDGFCGIIDELFLDLAAEASLPSRQSWSELTVQTIGCKLADGYTNKHRRTQIEVCNAAEIYSRAMKSDSFVYSPGPNGARSKKIARILQSKGQAACSKPELRTSGSSSAGGVGGGVGLESWFPSAGNVAAGSTAGE